jgi:hypothetical protein
MLPCEMARYIAGFPAEARKSGQFVGPPANRPSPGRANNLTRSGVRSDPGRGLTGFVFSISEHSAGISWLQPAQPAAAEAELVVAAVAEAAPDGRSGELAAAAAAVAAGPAEAVAAQASRSAEPDAAAVAVVQPGVVAPLAESAASARPAERALKALQRVWAATTAGVVEPPSFAPLPERSTLPPAPAPNRQLSADPRHLSVDPREVPADSFPAFSGHQRLRHQTPPPPETSSLGSSSPIYFQG